MKGLADRCRRLLAMDISPTAVAVARQRCAGFPNVAIVVGTRATVVVDTGMGPRNGAVVLRDVPPGATAVGVPARIIKAAPSLAA